MTDENRIARAALTRLLEPRDIVGAVACSIVGVAGSGPWLVELRVLGGGLDPATDRRCRSVAGGIGVPLAQAVRLPPDPRSIIHFSRRPCCHTVGAMFWFNRNRLVGSYSFFSSTSRRYVSAGYDARTSAVFASPVKFT